MLRRFIAPLLDALKEKRCVLCASALSPAEPFPPPAPGALAGPTAPPNPAAQPADPELSSPWRMGVCAACLQNMPRRATGYCLRCGELTASTGLAPGVCGVCAVHPPPWSELFFYGLYTGELRALLHSLKFYESLEKAPALGRLFLLHPGLRAALGGYRAVIPVPLHLSRLKERGFNQSLELAKPLAAYAQIPLNAELLDRSRPTRRQSGLTRAQRQSNMKDAFYASPKVKGLRVLLVDDIMTTGSTLAYAAKALLLAGAAEVGAAVLARTPGRNTMFALRPH